MPSQETIELVNWLYKAMWSDSSRVPEKKRAELLATILTGQPTRFTDEEWAKATTHERNKRPPRE